MTPVIHNWERGFRETHPLSLSPGDCKAGMFGNGPGASPDSSSLHPQPPKSVGQAYHCLGVARHLGWTTPIGPIKVKRQPRD